MTSDTVLNEQGCIRREVSIRKIARPVSAWLHVAFHRPGTQRYRVTSWLVGALIVISVALLVVELSWPVGDELRSVLVWADWVILILFGVEVSLRVFSYHPPALEVFRLTPAQRMTEHLWGRIRYSLRPMIMIDILTVAAVIPALRGLRALRLFRLLRTSRFFRYNDVFASMSRAADDNALLFGFALSAVCSCAIVGGISLYLVEFRSNPALHSVSDGIWWALVTLTTVGFGDIAPTTGLGRIVGGILMVAGMFCLALFAGVVGHTLLRAVVGIREEQFRLSERANHVVVCGYEPESRLLLDSLADELGDSSREVVLFAPGERPMDTPPRFTWIEGNPTKESQLKKVGLTRASSVIVVGRRSLDPQVADAVTLLTVFTIRRFLAREGKERPRRVPLYVIAEILDAENVDHAKSAGADEVIESTRVGFSMLCHALSTHGAARVLSAVAHSGDLNVYVGRLPPEMKGGTFGTVMDELKARYSAILIGVRREQGELLNPAATLPLPSASVVVYLAESKVLPPVDDDHHSQRPPSA